MKSGDVPLTTSTGIETSVLAVLGEMRQRWSVADDARKRARLNELFVYNRMMGDRLALEASVTVPLNAPLVTKNKLRNAVLTWANRLVKKRTTSTAWPADTDDIPKADASNAVLDYLRQLQNRDEILSDATITAAMHFLVGLYTTYDPDFGPSKERVAKINPLTGLAMRDLVGNVQYSTRPCSGAPKIETLSLEDFVTSGEQDAHLGKWLLVRRWLDPDEAWTLLRDATRDLRAQEATNDGANEIEAQAEGMRAAENVARPPSETIEDHLYGSEKRDATMGWEMWWRPNRLGRFPEGFFATVINDVVTNATTYPYDHGELPISIFRVMKMGKRFYASGWLEDALPQQVGLNHSERVKAHRAEIAGQVRILMMKNIAKLWGDSPDGVVECDTFDEVKGSVNPVEVPDIPRDMYEMSDRYESGIDDTAGVSGVASSGDTAAETKNARLVAYATQIDDEKNEHARTNLESAELVTDTQSLKLCQQFWPVERLIPVIGEDNSMDAQYFSAADIRGVDVRMIPGPGEEETPPGKAKDSEERMVMGSLDPAKGAEMSQTGLPTTAADGAARAAVQTLIQQAVGGQPVQADLTIPSAAALPELKKALTALAPYGPRVTMAIRALIQEYTDQQGQEQQEANAPMPQKGGQPKPRPQAGNAGDQLPNQGAQQ